MVIKNKCRVILTAAILKYWRYKNIGGRGEIRTHGGLAPTTVFKTVALNRSATLPYKFQSTNLTKRAL